MVRHTCTSFAVLAEAEAIITHGHTEYRRRRNICFLHIDRHNRQSDVPDLASLPRKRARSAATEKERMVVLEGLR